MKFIYLQCGEETNLRDPRSQEHYWTNIIIRHLDGLFGPNILTSSQLAC